MRPSARFAFVFYAAVAASAIGIPSARAQSGPRVTGIVGAVKRLEPDGSSADTPAGTPHPDDVPPSTIDLADCDADLRYQFVLGLSSITAGYAIEAWVGAADCTPLASRQTDATAVCWPVLPVVALAPTENPMTIDIRVQDLVSQAASATHSVLYSAAGSDVCPRLPSEPASLSLYFFFVDGSGNAVGPAQPYPLTLVANAAGFTVDAGEGGARGDAGGEGSGASAATAAKGANGGCAISQREPVEGAEWLVVGVAAVVASAVRRRRGSRRVARAA